MPKIEVDEEEYQRTQRVMASLRKIADNPATRLKLQALHKEVEPTAPTPELDQAKILQEPLTKLQKDFDDYKAKQETEQAEREKKEKLAALTGNWEAGRNALKRAGYTEEGIKNLEKFMEERGLIDHELAAAAHEKMFPLPPPATPSGVGAWNFLEVPDDSDADIKRLIETRGQSEALADRMAHKALNEVRAGQPRR
jgi:hypothetical protein